MAQHVPDGKIPTAQKAWPRRPQPVAPVWLQAPACRARPEQCQTKIALAIELIAGAIRHQVPCGGVRRLGRGRGLEPGLGAAAPGPEQPVQHAPPAGDGQLAAARRQRLEGMRAAKSPAQAEGGCRWLKDERGLVASWLVNNPCRLHGWLLVMTVAGRRYAVTPRRWRQP